MENPQEEPKQEPLEEAAEFNFEKQVSNPYSTGTAAYTAYEKGFELGAKWQSERMYDVLENLWVEYRTHTNNEDAWSFKEWLVEQFKKK